MMGISNLSQTNRTKMIKEENVLAETRASNYTNSSKQKQSVTANYGDFT